MTLPLPRLDDRTWQDLRDEGVSLIPRYAPEWTDHNASDPGITLIELMAYQTELELFRLDRISAAHRRAFLQVLGNRRLPNGPRYATTLLTPDPSSEAIRNPRALTAADMRPVSIRAGDYFVPRQLPSAVNVRHRSRRKAGTDKSVDVGPPPIVALPDEPILHSDATDVSPVPEFGFRAAHDVQLTGIRIAAVQSFDGRSFSDITNAMNQPRAVAVWGDNPVSSDETAADFQPAVYVGLNRSNFPGPAVSPAQTDLTLTLWCIPDGFSAADLSASPTEFEFADGSAAPPPVQSFAIRNVGTQRGYDPTRPVQRHHGMKVRWEYYTNGGWSTIPAGGSFRDETRGFTRPGRIVIPGQIIRSIAESVVGSISARHFYLRCRLAAGCPDRAPLIRGLFADAILVEQWDQTSTQCSVVPPERLGQLQLTEEMAADVHDAATDLARRGWGDVAKEKNNWPVFGPQGFVTSDDKTLAPQITGRSMNAIVIGVATGDPDQRYVLPCPAENTLFEAQSADRADDSPSIRILTDSLQIWTLEPPWSWKPTETNRLQFSKWLPRLWSLVPDFVPGARTIRHFLFDSRETRTKSRYTAPGQIVFGDGENGRVPPPGALIFASYSWTVAEAANFAAGFVWARSTEREPFHKDRVTWFPKLRFLNPLPAEGGTNEASLSSALYSMARELAAPKRLVELADAAKSDTLDGIDLSGIEPPSMAVNLLDFECLARTVPGTAVARARAWAEFDPNFPGHAAPGSVTVTLVPSMPANQPIPTDGLIRRVHAYLEERRPVACRVHVVGPDYTLIRIRATLHTSANRVEGVRSAAESAVRDFLHPTHGGQSGCGWPFGRHVHNGELMRILANVSHVKHVTGLQLATLNGEWSEAAVDVPPRSLVALMDTDFRVVGDA